jgi:hypothetical protein
VFNRASSVLFGSKASCAGGHALVVIERGHNSVMEVLLEFGVDIDASGGRFDSALGTACHKG